MKTLHLSVWSLLFANVLKWAKVWHKSGTTSELAHTFYAVIQCLFTCLCVHAFSMWTHFLAIWRYWCPISSPSNKDMEGRREEKKKDRWKDRGKEAGGCLKGLWDPSPDMAWICTGVSITSLLAARTHTHTQRQSGKSFVIQHSWCWVEHDRKREHAVNTLQTVCTLYQWKCVITMPVYVGAHSSCTSSTWVMALTFICSSVYYIAPAVQQDRLLLSLLTVWPLQIHACKYMGLQMHTHTLQLVISLLY